MFHRLARDLGAAGLLVLTCVVPSFAQDAWSWPEKPENPQVLPEDWPGSRLRAPMMGFTRALGVRCSYCHVGEEGQPLSSYNFSSDANPNKNRAREMLRMLGSINDHLDKIEPSGTTRVNMWCHTCHRGRPKPMTLGEELAEAYDVNGSEAAQLRYDELKRDFYGKGAYDFSDERALNTLGYRLLEDDDAEGAVKIFQTNAEAFPESWNAWDSLAEGFMKAGNNGMAQTHYRKSLELNPDNQNAKDMLERMKQVEGEQHDE